MSKPVAIVSDLWGYMLSVSWCKCRVIKNSREFVSFQTGLAGWISYSVVDVSRVVVVSDPVLPPDTVLEWSIHLGSSSILLHNFLYLGSLLYCHLYPCCVFFQDCFSSFGPPSFIISLYMSIVWLSSHSKRCWVVLNVMITWQLTCIMTFFRLYDKIDKE